MSKTAKLVYGSEWRGLTVGVPYEPDKESWRRERRNSCGSSDSAKIVGVSPYGQAWDVWWEKTREQGGE